MAEHRSNEDPDRVLLQALQSADDPDEPFRELHRRFRRRLLAFFSRRGFSTETSRELSQETFFRVYRSRGTFRGDVPLASWIFQIAANVVRNELRRRQANKRSGHEQSLDDDQEKQPVEVHTGGDPSPAASLARPLARTLAREQVEALGQTLQRLPPQMRRTLQMWIHHEFSVAKIATVMKVSESTVKVQLHQGRKRLRQALADRFGEPL